MLKNNTNPQSVQNTTSVEVKEHKLIEDTGDHKVSNTPKVTWSNIESKESNTHILFDCSASMFNMDYRAIHAVDILNSLRHKDLKDAVFIPFGHTGFFGNDSRSKGDAHEWSIHEPNINNIKNGKLTFSNLCKTARYSSSSNQTSLQAIEYVWEGTLASKKPNLLVIISDGQFSPSKFDGKIMSGEKAFKYLLNKHKKKNYFSNLSRVVLRFANHTDVNDQNMVTSVVKNLICTGNAIQFECSKLPLEDVIDLKIGNTVSYVNMYPNHNNLDNKLYVSPKASPQDIAKWVTESTENQERFAWVLEKIAVMFRVSPELLTKENSIYVKIHRTRSILNYSDNISENLLLQMKNYINSFALAKNNIKDPKLLKSLEVFLARAYDGTPAYIRYLKSIERTSTEWLQYHNDAKQAGVTIRDLIDNLENAETFLSEEHKHITKSMSGPSFIKHVNVLLGLKISYEPIINRYTIPIPSYNDDPKYIMEFFKMIFYPITGRLLSKQALLITILKCLYTQSKQDAVFESDGFEYDNKDSIIELKLRQLADIVLKSGHLKRLVNSVFENKIIFTKSIYYTPYCKLLIVALRHNSNLFEDKKEETILLNLIYDVIITGMRINKSRLDHVVTVNASNMFKLDCKTFNDGDFKTTLCLIEDTSFTENGKLDPYPGLPSVCIVIEPPGDKNNALVQYLDVLPIYSPKDAIQHLKEGKENYVDATISHLRHLTPVMDVDYKKAYLIASVLVEMKKTCTDYKNGIPMYKVDEVFTQRRENDKKIIDLVNELSAETEYVKVPKTKSLSAKELLSNLGFGKTPYGQFLINNLGKGLNIREFVENIGEVKLPDISGPINFKIGEMKFELDKERVDEINEFITGGNNLIKCDLCERDTTNNDIKKCSMCPGTMCNRCCRISYMNPTKYKIGEHFNLNKHKCVYCRQINPEHLEELKLIAINDPNNIIPVQENRYSKCKGCYKWMCFEPSDRKTDIPEDSCHINDYENRDVCESCENLFKEITNNHTNGIIKCPNPICNNKMVHGGGCNVMICCDKDYHYHDVYDGDYKQCSSFGKPGCCHMKFSINRVVLEAIKDSEHRFMYNFDVDMDENNPFGLDPRELTIFRRLCVVYNTN